MYAKLPSHDFDPITNQEKYEYSDKQTHAPKNKVDGVALPVFEGIKHLLRIGDVPKWSKNLAVFVQGLKSLELHDMVTQLLSLGDILQKNKGWEGNELYFLQLIHDKLMDEKIE